MPRYRFFILRCACVILIVIGCSEERKSPITSDSSVVHLTYWPASNPHEIQLADSIVRMWNHLNPTIQVRMQPIPSGKSTEEILLAAIAGKTTPDVCSNIWPGALHDYTEAGGLVVLDDFPDFDSLASSRVPRELLEAFRSEDGHYHQFPWKTNPLMMYYNVRLFQEAGVDSVPRTYSEYLAAGEKVTRDMNDDGQIDIWMGERDILPIWWQRLMDFYPFYIAASKGKTLFSQGEIAFAGAAAEKVFAFFQQCYARRLFPRTFFQGGAPFLLEKKATHFAGPWHIATLKKFAPHIEYGVTPILVPDDHEGPVYTTGDYKNIAIFSTTRHPEAAWEFVKFLVRNESDLLLLEIADQLPLRGDLLTNSLFTDYFYRIPLMVNFARQVPFTRGLDKVPDLREIFDALSQEYEACSVYGQKTPAEAVRDAARRTRLILEWNR